MTALTEKVIDVRHHGDRLFEFTVTRSQSFRFKNGEFAMIGLPGLSVFRAYSVVSTNYEDTLRFYSIKVPDGVFTTQLQLIRPGDEILIRPKTTGSLVIDYVLPRKNLVMLATGTGIAPFMSIAHDYATYERFENVYLYHTVRLANEIVFQHQLLELAVEWPFKYIESVTQEPYHREGRFWDHVHDLDPGTDAIMVCGSPELNKQCRTKFQALGWTEGNTGELGNLMLERAFAG
jgi:ferredoxin/flavodoxin---NADP+ reductase